MKPLTNQSCSSTLSFPLPSYFFCFVFWPDCVACGILIPWPGIESGPSAVKMQSSNHWRAREFLQPHFIVCLFVCFFNLTHEKTVKNQSLLAQWITDQNKVMVEKIEETKAKHRARYFKYFKTYTLVKMGRGFPSGSLQVKNPPAMQELQVTWVQSLDQEDPLEEGMVTHSSILAWRIPWTEEPGGLQSMGLQRVRHDWSDLACTQKGEDTVSLK